MHAEAKEFLWQRIRESAKATRLPVEHAGGWRRAGYSGPVNAIPLSLHRRGHAREEGSTHDFTRTRRKPALAEMAFVREFSETLSGTWSRTGGTVETILDDDGVI